MDEKTKMKVGAVEEADNTDVRHYIGTNFSCTDGSDPTSPESHMLDSSNALEWLSKYPEHLENPELQILSTRISKEAVKNGFDIPYSRKVMETAIWGPEVYTDWSRLKSGGCFTLADFPVRFVLQTPNDGFPFVSLAMSRSGRICRGIMSYDDSIFEPIQALQGEIMYSGWRSDGLQIICLPQAMLKVHAKWLSDAINQTLDRLTAVEEVLASPYVSNIAEMQRTLHQCQDSMLRLERRSEFEAIIITAIESTMSSLNHRGAGPINSLAPAKAQLQLRRADLANIPRRIESARSAVNDYILQQTQAQSLQIAQATQRIAEATMNDSASMKTIAILTMIFLPGTAVASFFSMTMWNWSADTGQSLVSPWLWIYFVVATPLTLGVIGLWYFWMRVRTRQLTASLPTMLTQPAPPYSGMKSGTDIKVD